MKAHVAIERAARAALGKKASEVVILDLRKAVAFTDYFVLASGANQKQILAIADAVLETMRDAGLRPNHVEGYPRQEWILLDYADFDGAALLSDDPFIGASIAGGKITIPTEPGLGVRVRL